MSKLIIAIVAYVAVGFVFRWVFQKLTKYANEKKDYNELILWWPWIVAGVVVGYVIYGLMVLMWRFDKYVKKILKEVWRI